MQSPAWIRRCEHADTPKPAATRCAEIAKAVEQADARLHETAAAGGIFVDRNGAPNLNSVSATAST